MHPLLIRTDSIHSNINILFCMEVGHFVRWKQRRSNTRVLFNCLSSTHPVLQLTSPIQRQLLCVYWIQPHAIYISVNHRWDSSLRMMKPIRCWACWERLVRWILVGTVSGPTAPSIQLQALSKVQCMLGTYVCCFRRPSAYGTNEELISCGHKSARFPWITHHVFGPDKRVLKVTLCTDRI